MKVVAEERRKKRAAAAQATSGHRDNDVAPDDVAAEIDSDELYSSCTPLCESC